ncbi:putative ribosome quality control (RQC) complex YloA/Tae2 family protein [Pontibacter aydingkolensis]|uniref:NFACT RNA binding domain-containing protein n=1 Tax=Pontibacter aydingkolensis TaxID=1911536 RepID=A0ABS7CUE3_9BACT|nr:NFACT RNA binding domain-containing protein [Pontibacter aydingkolensis]MBW7467478.1 NFACT RNA binding domain-containing protein [Pontibacter aydingkolensis]
MHQNYYFLRQLTTELGYKLVGMKAITAFTQNKGELVLGFASDEKEFYIRALLTSQFTSLSFPSDFKRARANTMELMQAMQGQTVQEVVQHQNERSFYLKLTDGFILLFKLFGNRSNIILFQHGEPVELFRKKFGADADLDPLQMHRPLQQNYEAFATANGDIKKVYPTFGELPVLYLATQKYGEQTLEQKWELVQSMLDVLLAPEAYYIIRLEDKLRLSLLPIGEIIYTYTNPLEALNAYTRLYLSETGYERQHTQAKQQLERKLHVTKTVLEQSEAKIKELKHNKSYSQTADVIMANLTNIPPRATEIELYDFYTDQTRIYTLKQGETPQKYAERLYRKAKNQHVEVQQLEEKAERKLEEAIILEDALQALLEANDYKKLKLFLREYAPLLVSKQQALQEVPFRVFETEGYKILVGKSAKNNDELTQRHSYKEDLWLHAKDVSGSHVIIKHQAGKTVPATVLEKAAQLAAYYSKRKSDSLCPVIYTPKKWVRKPKGAAPGAVVVEREKVILVKPENPFEKRK